eukprot:Skav233512  [mRNA]  locus=scaffold2242:42780:44306:+ [translate_table: standard]
MLEDCHVQGIPIPARGDDSGLVGFSAGGGSALLSIISHVCRSDSCSITTETLDCLGRRLSLPRPSKGKVCASSATAP